MGLDTIVWDMGAPVRRPDGSLYCERIRLTCCKDFPPLAGEPVGQWLDGWALYFQGKIGGVDREGWTVPALRSAHYVGRVDSATVPVVLAALDRVRRGFRAALRWNGSALVIDVAAARQVQRAYLLWRRDRPQRGLLAKITERILEAEDEGDALRAAGLKIKRRDMRRLDTSLDGRLAAIADLTELANYEPPEFSGF